MSTETRASPISPGPSPMVAELPVPLPMPAPQHFSSWVFDAEAYRRTHVEEDPTVMSFANLPVPMST